MDKVDKRGVDLTERVSFYSLTTNAMQKGKSAPIPSMYLAMRIS
jgi:hypothetical protein